MPTATLYVPVGVAFNAPSPRAVLYGDALSVRPVSPPPSAQVSPPVLPDCADRK